MNAVSPDQFQAWREALRTGKPVAYEHGQPTAGYYKTRARNADRSVRWDAVAIWKDEHLGWCADRTGPRAAPMLAEEIEELFVGCNSTPISYELFEHIANGGAWPEDVAPVEAAPDLAPHEAAAAELKAQQDAAKAWATGLKDAEGKTRKPATQEEADKAANYAEVFGKLEKTADKTREAEKAPHLEAGRAVDAKWKPTIESAATAKKWAKGLAEDFAKAEAARRAEEARIANEKAQREYAEAQAKAKAEAEQRAALEAKGVQLPEFAPPPEPPKVIAADPVKIGTGSRRQSLRKVPTWEITDASAMLKFFAERNIKSDAILAAALADAKTLMTAGISVPGVVKGEREEIV
jgi:hypothetical protein